MTDLEKMNTGDPFTKLGPLPEWMSKNMDFVPGDVIRRAIAEWKARGFPKIILQHYTRPWPRQNQDTHS